MQFRPYRERILQIINEVRAEEGKPPYEQFFIDALHHHTREGFLHQKLVEPRSYDFNRIRTWDDRLRMPQFKFARPGRKPGESRRREDRSASGEGEDTTRRRVVHQFEISQAFGRCIGTPPSRLSRLLGSICARMPENGGPSLRPSCKF